MTNRRKAAIDAAVAAGDATPEATALKIVSATTNDNVLNPSNAPAVVRTVELELERALFKAGCITEGNLGDLDRMVPVVLLSSSRTTLP